MKIKNMNNSKITQSRKKILIFEDDQFIADMYKTKFEQEGFQVVWYANTTADPVTLVESEKPDLITMDVIMPGMDGYEATKLLKANQITKSIPIVGFDNLGMPSNMVQALQSGMDHYFVKSELVPSKFVEVIRRVIASPHQAGPCNAGYQTDEDGNIIHEGRGPCNAHAVTTVQLLDEISKDREYREGMYKAVLVKRAFISNSGMDWKVIFVWSIIIPATVSIVLLLAIAFFPI